MLGGTLNIDGAGNMILVRKFEEKGLLART
jgi:hypothetical protein